MTWTNAFDLGSCLVEVFQVATPDAPDYSEVIAKGDSADLTLSSWAMHIAVSSGGVITLTNLGSAIEVDVGARIVPAYSLASAQGAQAVLPTSASGAGDASADGAGLASFTNGGASVDLSDQSPYDRISVQTNTIGSSSVNPVVQFTPQFDIPVIPEPPLPSIRQMTTHRISRGIDSPVACYVRSDEGRIDLSASSLSAVIRAYGRQWPLATLDAVGDANGKVNFTVPASLFAWVGVGYDYGLSCDPRNLASFDVLADGVLVYRALMEIV